MRILIYILTFSCIGTTSQALVTELGLSYGYSKKTFNASNYYQTESKSASLAFYLFEKIALEISHTHSFYESQEVDSTASRTVQQTSQISDGALIYTMFDRKSMVQPYVKAGAAYIKKNQVVKYLNAAAISVPESAGWAPSYGLGLKIALTQTFNLKLSYEAWQTPLSDGTHSEDNTFKAGLSWYL